MSGVTASPSLVILDVDGQKRYRFESDKAGHAMPCYSLPTFFLEKIEISSPVHLLGVVQDLDIAEMRDFVAAFREGTLKVHGFREISLLLIG